MFFLKFDQVSAQSDYMSQSERHSHNEGVARGTGNGNEAEDDQEEVGVLWQDRSSLDLEVELGLAGPDVGEVVPFGTDPEAGDAKVLRLELPDVLVVRHFLATDRVAWNTERGHTGPHLLDSSGLVVGVVQVALGEHSLGITESSVVEAEGLVDVPVTLKVLRRGDVEGEHLARSNLNAPNGGKPLGVGLGVPVFFPGGVNGGVEGDEVRRGRCKV